MRSVGLGILGSGFMGATHAKAAKNLPGLELVAVACGSRAERLSRDYRIGFEASAEALIQRADVDAIVIATPHFAHYAEARAALQAGKHLLIEKPMTTSLVECEELADLARSEGLVLATGYHQRFRVNNQAARKLVRSGEIGDVLTVQVSMPFDIASLRSSGFGGDWNWWGDPRSVGHIINSAPHAIDTLRWIMGSEVTKVSAFSRTYREHSSVEDTTMAILCFDNGALVSLYSSCALPAPPFPGEDFRFRIVGTKALLDLDPFEELRLGNRDGWQIVSTQPRVGHSDSNTAFLPSRIQAYTDQLAAFVRAICGESLDAGSAEDGCIGVKISLAMLEASRTEAVLHIK